MNDEYSLYFATQSDTDDWMCLVEVVADNFPGLDMKDYRETLIKNIERQSAICVRKQSEIVGILLFSIKQRTLSCMAVHPDHRKKGLASAMVEQMIAAFPKKSEIWVSTFREDDPKGNAPRALYKRLGFIEGELITEFDYPCQKFVLRK